MTKIEQGLAAGRSTLLVQSAAAGPHRPQSCRPVLTFPQARRAERPKRQGRVLLETE